MAHEDFADDLPPTPSEWGPTAALLDQLVDGALTVAEEQAVLAELALQPDGWKRLALAFVEHRAFAQAAKEWLSDGIAEPSAVPIPVRCQTAAVPTNGNAMTVVGVCDANRSALQISREPSSSRDVSRQLVTGRSRRWASLAVLLMLAFAGGRWSGRLGIESVPPMREPIASAVSEQTVARDTRPHVGDEPFVDRGEGGAAEGTDSRVATAGLPETEATELALVRWDSADPNAEPVRVPVVRNVDLATLEAWSEALALPAEWEAVLAARGQHLEQQSDWLNVQLPDGTQGIMPVREVVLRTGARVQYP